MNDAAPTPSRVVDSYLDITRPLYADGPPDPVVYDGSSRAIRQRTVNFAAKRFADMMYVTGLDRGTAERHFRWRAVAIPGGLIARPDASDQELIAAHRAGRLTIETNDTDRRATVQWSDPAFGAPLTGSAIARPGYGGILLGSRLASRLSVYPGDVVTLVPVTQAKMNPALGVAVPRFWKFEVTGLFDTGMFQYDNQFVVLSRETAQRFTGLGNAVSGIAVRVNDPERAPAIGAALEKRLGYPYRALDWQTQNASLFSALQLEKLAMGLIIFFIMVVAAFNIVGTLTMVVTDKTREIGILRAMGLTSPAVGRVFLVQGAVIGGIGTALGLVLGLSVAYIVDRSGWVRINPAVYFIDHLPVHIEWLDVAIVVLASLAIAVCATLYPSRSAAALTPVDAIRHE